jgi:hypothetical protein
VAIQLCINTPSLYAILPSRPPRQLNFRIFSNLPTSARANTQILVAVLLLLMISRQNHYDSLSGCRRVSSPSRGKQAKAYPTPPSSPPTTPPPPLRARVSVLRHRTHPKLESNLGAPRSHHGAADLMHPRAATGYAYFLRCSLHARFY